MTWQTSSSRPGYYQELHDLVSRCPESHMIISTRNDIINLQGSPKAVFEPRPTTGGAPPGICWESAGLNEIDVSRKSANNRNRILPCAWQKIFCRS